MRCDSTCKICFNDNSCSACQDSYFLDIKSGKCQSKCDKGFYEDICNIESGSLCCKEICGDGLLFTLLCDDKNTFDGDGCSSTCNIEQNFFCFYNYKNLLSICNHITPLIANISLPNDSATLIQIQFNQPVINWNQYLTEYINVQISLETPNVYIYNWTFINNSTIDIMFQYNISFKSAELVINFLNTSAFISELNQTLTTKSLSIRLPNYNYYSPKTEILLKGMIQISESSQTSTSIAISFLTVTNLSPLIVWILLSSLQMMFYLSLIRIKYPRNFINIIKGGKIFTFSSLPNYLLIYAQKKNYLKDINSIFQDNEMTSSFLIDNESTIFSLIQLMIIHGLLFIIAHITGYKFIALINKNSYYQNIIAKSGYIILVCLLSIFHLGYTNWLQGLSAAISYFILLFLIRWITHKLLKFEFEEELQENDEFGLLLFPSYLPKCQIFGLIDLLRKIIFAISLIIFEYYLIVNILLILTTQILYIILLIKYKPTDNNKIFIFSESSNLLILLICLIWAIDDNVDFLTEDHRSNIGWFAIGVVGFSFLVTSLVAIIRENKNNVKKLWEKCKKRRNTQIDL